uniref:Growth hormone receptor type 2a n=1 Tax=Cyprinus carpio TaxID=7962 RepID=D2Y3F9_CYPCA|nr:growth hormone receptor type 2a [Cyprinus carpio]
METALLICILLTCAVATQSVPPTIQGQTSTLPHLTGCFSRELMTFRCQWETGSLQNHTELEDLSLFYMLEKDSKKWMECPSYSSIRKNECYFDSSNTIIWFPYVVQLRSRSLDVVYDEMSFNVEDIVFPDPPVGLNWTLLSMGSTGLIYDVVVSWDPPPSAAENMKTGWILLVYETQYREKGSDQWNSLDNGKDTQAHIYGLRSNIEYEVRVRSKMRGYNFGVFSDSILILIPNTESRIPVTAVLVFAAVGIVIILMLVVVSRQQKLMVIFLPPVPGPKIKGIDPMLLQKGQLSEFTSILGTQSGLRPELYSKDPWVEFIQLDLDDPAEKNESSDTQHLLGVSRSGSSHVLNFKSDDDSGRASCYDPEISNPEDLASLLPGHSGRGDNHPLVSRSSSSIPDLGVQQTSEIEETPIQTQPAVPSWVNMDFYAQVSDFTPAGGVVLSPGQLNSSPVKKKGEGNEKKIQYQLLSDGAYTSENTARLLSADVPPSPGPEQGYQAFPTQAVEGNLWNGEYLVSANDSQTPCLVPEAPPAPILPPVSDYTVVQEVDAQHSLLLNPSSSQPAICPHSPNKHLPVIPTMPMGYLTPDLLGNLTP